MANPKLKQYSNIGWSSGAITVVIKDGPGTLHSVITGANVNGDDLSVGSNATFYLFDNATTATGALVTAQRGYPCGNSFEFELDFSQGLTLKLNGAGLAGAVTVIYS